MAEVSEKKVPSWVQAWAKEYTSEKLMTMMTILKLSTLPKEEVEALLQGLKK